AQYRRCRRSRVGARRDRARIVAGRGRPDSRRRTSSRGGSSMKSSRFTRRRFVKGLAGGAGGATPGRTARGAAAGEKGLGTWGGDYSKLLTQNVEAPILTPKGIEVVHDIANDSPRRAKLIAEQRLPRGTTDLQALSAAGSREMFNAGVLEPIDYSKIPNAPHLL